MRFVPASTREVRSLVFHPPQHGFFIIRSLHRRGLDRPHFAGVGSLGKFIVSEAGEAYDLGTILQNREGAYGL